MRPLSLSLLVLSLLFPFNARGADEGYCVLNGVLSLSVKRSDCRGFFTSEYEAAHSAMMNQRVPLRRSDLRENSYDDAHQQALKESRERLELEMRIRAEYEAQMQRNAEQERDRELLLLMMMQMQQGQRYYSNPILDLANEAIRLQNEINEANRLRFDALRSRRIDCLPYLGGFSCQ